MKTLYTTTLALSLSISCLYAQRIHFTDTSNRWVVYGRFFEEETRRTYSGDTYLLLKDTIDSGEAGYAFYIHDSSEVIEIYADLLITEDTVEKKVYARRFGEADTTRFVLYDFNMDVEDTLPFPFGWYADHVCGEVYPDVLIDSVPYRAFHINDGCYSYNVIEGVGSLRGPLYPYFGCGERSHTELSCFENNGERPVFSSLFSNSCFVTDIAEREISYPAIDLLPNPSWGLINIEARLVDRLYRLSIHDIVGRQVYQSELKDKITLDISTWQAGTYLVCIADMKGNTTLKRFVKL